MSSQQVQEPENVVEEVQEQENTAKNVKLPPSRVDKVLRKKFAHKAMGSATSKYTTAVIEEVLASILERAGENARADGKKRATLQHLLRSVRSDRASAKFFRAYVFASTNGLKFDSMALLNSKDREIATKKRLEAKEKAKEKKQAAIVPSIDQE
jgi:histone H3/H4